jgi:copper chaperone CopZ
MRIEVLYFQGCPNHVPTVSLVRQVAAELGVKGDMHEVEVLTPEDVHRLRFLGSPSVHVNGIDIEPEARQRTDFAFGCRMYGRTGTPSRAMVEAAVKEALTSDAGDRCAPPTRQTEDSNPHPAGLLTAGASVLSAAAASACCWLPLLLLAFGFSAAGVSAAFAKVRPYFLASAAVFLAAGFYLVYVRKEHCAPGTACATANAKGQRRNRAMLWVAVVAVALFAFFPSYAGLFAKSGSADGSRNAKGDGQTLVFDLAGMTCEACAAHIQKALADVPGVQGVTVSYDKHEAHVSVSSISPPATESLIAGVSKAGYAAVLRHQER